MSQFNHLDAMLSDDDEDEYCPLCIEPLDLSDKHFKPCPCGYQICSFCYNNIRTNPELNGKCPGCRRLYDDASVTYITLSPEELKIEQMKQMKKEKERKQREKEKREMAYNSKKQLSSMRVIQKNLVYVIGVNAPAQAVNQVTGLVNSAEMVHILKSDKYFGKYGKVVKLVVNKLSSSINSSFGVYVTYSKKGEAAECISQLDGAFLDGKSVKAAYGTTKYCSSYLREQTCPNPNCMFLHEPSDEADLFQKSGPGKTTSSGYHSKSHHAALPKITPPMRLSAPSNALDSEHKNTSSLGTSLSTAHSSPPSSGSTTHGLDGHAHKQSIKSLTSTPQQTTQGLSNVITGGNPWITKDERGETSSNISLGSTQLNDSKVGLTSLLSKTTINQQREQQAPSQNKINRQRLNDHDCEGHARVILDGYVELVRNLENRPLSLDEKSLFSEEELQSEVLNKIPTFITNIEIQDQTPTSVYESCLAMLSVKPHDQMLEFMNLEKELQQSLQIEHQMDMFNHNEQFIARYMQRYQKNQMWPQGNNQQVMQGPPPGLVSQEDGNTVNITKQLFNANQTA
ncbi:uncharacterized protein HGUI_00803 [Hanseniaspora guilliermondii]|uniref:General negative regulator of transcription subunit 4 n=1 Tax=Hanseniaspora guilliermondii TaxID=56406 RepID=A0A1L0B0V6_9ASCO|nr:uncharacterized protein HGUI_00803 [Hanseniaspora guilliermondii]